MGEDIAHRIEHNACLVGVVLVTREEVALAAPDHAVLIPIPSRGVEHSPQKEFRALAVGVLRVLPVRQRYFFLRRVEDGDRLGHRVLGVVRVDLAAVRADDPVGFPRVELPRIRVRQLAFAVPLAAFLAFPVGAADVHQTRLPRYGGADLLLGHLHDVEAIFCQLLAADAFQVILKHRVFEDRAFVRFFGSIGGERSADRAPKNHEPHQCIL